MNIHSHILAKPAASLLTLALALALSGCGGGGGNPGTTTGTGSGGTGTGGTTTPAAPTVSLAFANSSGQSTNALTSATQLTAKATVRDAAGKAVPNALVTFATDNNLAVFSPSAGTALTDANGVASITMHAASLAAGGAGTVTVTTSVAGASVTGTANYSVGATTLTFGTLTANPTSIGAYESTVLSVDLLAGGTKYTDQVNVNFSSACVSAGKASLASVVASNKGTATTVYRDQGCGNNDTITVSAAGVANPATTQLVIAAPGAASVQFEQASPANQSIVIQGQGGNGRTETASLKFKVMDIFNHPLAGASVDFSASTNAVHVNKTADTTDQNGEVITTVNSGATATSFRVKAALHDNPNVFTWSDSIVVTTGLPVQRAFSLSAEAYNLDGTLESSPTKPATHLQAMIADQFGNPVPDGTPVVFQTNMGSVGSASQGGCITTNGGCSVDFRVQNPRVATPGVPATPCNAVAPDSTRPGVATVCASTTDGTNTVFGKLALFFTGNHASHVYMDNVLIPIPVDVSSDNGTDLGTLKSSGSRSVTLQLNDSADNPLPVGTTVTIANAVNVNVQGPTPATVPIIGTHSPTADDVTGANVSGPQGSKHIFSVSAPSPDCKGPLDAKFSVVTTTPTGAVTNIPFKLAFSCP
jgi:hypothetical protein